MSADKKETEHETKRLVVFDVEGVLIPKNRYLLFEISRKVDFLGFIYILVLGFFYEIRVLSLEHALKRIFAILKGLNAEEFLVLHKRMPLMPGTEKVFKRLNMSGYKTALISSGLPTEVVEDLATRLHADYAYGLELEIVENRLTGAIGGDVIKQRGKAIILQKILDKEKLKPQDCVMVADDRNNLPMFPLCKLRIGYNPDFMLTAKSDFVIKGALTEILPKITGKSPMHSKHSFSKSRSLREAIHITSYLLSFICIYLTGNILLACLIILLAVFYTISEASRVRGINLPILQAVTWKAANKTELYEFAAAPIHFALGIAISLIVFPEPIRYIAITVLTLGDSGAHIFGMKFGKTKLPFNKGKSVEGTLFGILLAFLGAMIFIEPCRALIAATIGMLVEGIPCPLNDNLTIPLVTGLVLLIIM